MKYIFWGKIAIIAVTSCLFIRAEELVVTIDSLVKIIDEDKSECSLASWRTVDNTCRCYLIKHAQRIFDGAERAADVVDKALKASKCNAASLKQLKSGLVAANRGDDEESYKKLIHSIYDNSVVVKTVAAAGMIDDKGNFTQTGLKQFLKIAQQEGKIPSDAFGTENTLKVKALTAEQKEAPWGTRQLFSIQSQRGGKTTEFILKEMKEPTKEVSRLVSIEKSKKFDEITYPMHADGLPQFVFPLAYLSYESQGKRHQLTLMPTAPGIQLLQLIKDFSAHPDDKKINRMIAFAYFDIGAAMARFYKKYASGAGSSNSHLSTGVIQGDLHAGNVYYDADTHAVVLIDNEQMATRLAAPENVCKDIAFLIMKSLYVLKWVGFPMKEKDFPYQEWYELSLPSFIAGYLSTYPKNEVEAIFSSIKNCIEKYRDEVKKDTVAVWYDDTSILGFALKGYIAPLLKRLEPWVKNHFIASDIDVNKQDDGGKTPLYEAVEKERLIMWPLIAAGATVNARDKHDNTPLHDAAYFNKVKAIKVLVDAGAHINAQDRNGDTPLHKAGFAKSKDAFELLKKLGADSKIKNNDGVVAKIAH